MTLERSPDVFLFFALRAGDSYILVGGTLNFIQMGVLLANREAGNRLEEATNEDIWKGLKFFPFVSKVPFFGQALRPLK